MKSWKSKVTCGAGLLTVCGLLNSCALFGGGEYASQTEVETDVPESLAQGKPSQGPAAPAYAENNGVPSSSNLIDVPDPYASAAPAPLPSGTPGGASLTSLPTDSSKSLIDIPKPDPSFGSVSVHNSRPPAEMLSLGPPLTPASPRMSLPAGTANAAGTSVVTEKIEPLAPAAAPKDAVTASAPRALPANSSEPGVPLLHSGSRLNDFYKDLHGQLLDHNVVENKVTGDTSVVTPPPPSDDAAVPPPPPTE